MHYIIFERVITLRKFCRVILKIENKFKKCRKMQKKKQKICIDAMYKNKKKNRSLNFRIIYESLPPQ